MFDLRLFKLTILSVAIAMGMFVQSKEAHAAEVEVLTIAGGCFWCVESDFEGVPGVLDVVSGYVSTAENGSFEAVKITFDPLEVSHGALMHMFFRSIDPTDPSGQFCDRGEIYRTAIFPGDSLQKSAAEFAKEEAETELGQPIVTSILKAASFRVAKDSHQDYYKGDNLVLTRFGPKRQYNAYKAYRKGCGRDARVEELWGSKAPFVSS
ncbi:MAG: peptide-methionine (S)-S-oxide reductase [Pseudomonadota bacterium]